MSATIPAHDDGSDPEIGTDAYYEAFTEHLISATAFLEQTNTKPRWIVRGIVGPGTFTHFYSVEGTGKTRFVWQVAYAVAAGLPYVPNTGFEVCEHGRVILLEYDMSTAETRAMLLRRPAGGLHPLRYDPSP